jgi:uncharacterized protein (DUF2141 family)
MGSISASGIGFAVLTGVWAASTTSAAEPLDAAGNGELHVRIENLRNDRGLIQACLTREPARFPNCEADPRAFRASIAAKSAAQLRFPNVPSGNYALAVIHDANANGRLDTFAGIPREGFGFSRNPPIRFGPPRFEEARFAITPGLNSQTISVRYLL